MAHTVLLFLTSLFGQYLCAPYNKRDENIGGSNEIYEEKYISQYLDHFNYLAGKGNQVFDQRYLVTEKYFSKGNGPVLFYCGNEGDIVSFWDNTGFMFELARELRALVVFGEHRYYGKSLPFGDKSFDSTNIGFLSIEQALADYAVLLKDIQKKYGNVSSIFAMGGSYGGLLAGYMRFKYPHIISGAVASSAPFFTIAGLRPRSEFFQSVTETFRKADSKCPLRIQQAFYKLQTLFDGGDLEEIRKTFHLCTPQFLRPDFELNMFSWLRNAFVLLAMVDYPYPAKFMADLPGHPVNVACSYMAAPYDNLLGLANISQLLYGRNVKCHDTFAEYVQCSDPTGCGTGAANAPWDYQACTEMILPGGSTNETDMFPEIAFTISMRTEYCQNRFGLGKARPDWIGTNYFETLDDIKKTSHIIFPNGDLDPWTPGGVLKDLSDSLIAILIKGGAHHLDLRASNKADPPSVTAARKRITGILKKWIEDS